MPAKEIPTGSTVTYSRQFRRRGKPDCPTCRAGGHGPYWYAYWREGGRRHSLYLGKRLPPGTAPQAEAVDVAGARAATIASAPAQASGPDTLRVRALGAFQVWQGETPIPPERWQRRKPAALMKCLLSAPDYRLQRDQVLDWLWPEASPAEGARNLHAAVHRLRQILDRPGATNSHLRLAGDLRSGRGLIAPPDLLSRSIRSGRNPVRT
ncbi:MAG TPA: hypothetical protein VHB98_22445 [Chloroflexota bacterium]|jgi:hypothetical protein|nr:hypothetical protein [Chloroflexota bacterium]